MFTGTSDKPEKKILPVNLEHGITNPCWNYVRLCAIMSDEKYLPWFVERFININISREFLIDYFIPGEFNPFSFYDEVLEFEEIKSKENIIEGIIEAISSNGYVLLLCDEYHISGTPSYQKNHLLHEMLIFGYDLSTKEADFVFTNVNGKIWGTFTIGFDNLVEAFKSGLEVINNKPEDWKWICIYGLPVSVFYLKDSFNRAPRLEAVYNSLVKNLQGGEIAFDRAFDRNINGSGIFRNGVSVYKSYYDDLYKRLLGIEDKKLFNSSGYEQVILLGMKYLYENKKALAFRLNYLNDKGYLIIPDALLQEMNELCNFIDKAVVFMAIYGYTFDEGRLEKGVELFKEAQKLDIKISTMLIDILEAHMKNKFLL
jgi:hypothetical protein